MCSTRNKILLRIPALFEIHREDDAGDEHHDADHDDDRAEDGDGVRKAAAAHAGRAERGGDDVPGAVIPDRAASRKVGEAAVSAEG